MIYKDLKAYIKSDLYRYAGKTSIVIFIKFFLTNKYFRFLFYYRLAKSNRKILRIVSRIFRPMLENKTGIQMPINVTLGYGAYIPHGNIVINSTAKIGDNCTICQFSSIGSTSKKAAIIGDRVYIGPNVSIVESVVIKNNIVIGAGSVVVKYIENYATVVGCPAKVINNNNTVEKIITNMYKSK